jgi:hypothetical protein
MSVGDPAMADRLYAALGEATVDCTPEQALGFYMRLSLILAVQINDFDPLLDAIRQARP